jgi:metallo-beta-lactamase class B
MTGLWVDRLGCESALVAGFVAALLLIGCSGHTTTEALAPAASSPTPSPTATATASAAGGAGGSLVPTAPASITLGPGLTIRDLGGDVWEVTHALPWPANSLLVASFDGTVVLVGTPYTPEATRLVLDWARGRFRQPKFVAINTGYHVDNLGGNAALREAGIPIWGSDLTATLLAQRGELIRRWTLTMVGDAQSDAAKVHAQIPYLPPDKLFPATDGYTLMLGFEPIQLLYLGPSQAPDKLAVYFPERRVLFGGCMVLGRDRAGNLAEADVEGWQRAIGVLQSLPADVVVPGHGERTDRGLLELTLDVLSKLDPAEVAEQHRKAGVSEPRACPEGMVTLPAGSFSLGSDTDEDNPLGAHLTALGSFCLDRTEVTVEAFASCVKAGACTAAATTMGEDFSSAERALFDPWFNGARQQRRLHPVNGVTWAQARSYCAWRGGRLPTQTEWEYAARDAGQLGDAYAWDPTDKSLRTHNGCGRECVRMLRRHGMPNAEGYPWDDGYVGTAPVGTFKDGATAQGLVDMEGNVVEWTSSIWLRHFSGPKEEPCRILSGSSWLAAMPPSPSVHAGQNTDWVFPDIGLRCAADVW